VCAALLHRYRRVPIKYWKPVQTGIEQDDDTAEVLRLSERPAEAALDAGVRLPRPVSPHLAARLDGSVVDMDALVGLAERHAAAGRWIVEGAGGVLVPLTEQTLLAEFIGRLRLPALVVSRSGLGTINHTLLTLEALRRRAVAVAGVVMVGPPDCENRIAIERFGDVSVVGELPMLDPLAPRELGRWADASLDPGARLMAYLS
jgi:dethiobiotin synthase